MAIKAIFFDVSDTLYKCPEFEDAQSDVPISLLSLRRGISSGEARQIFDRTKKELERKMVHATKGAVLKELGISKQELHDGLMKVEPTMFLKHDEELGRILGRLGERFEIGVITNIREAYLDSILGALAIDRGGFKHVVSADNTKNSKPHEEPFLKAIDMCGFRADECVYVGDSLTKDMIPAKKVGMRTIWVCSDAKEDENVDVRIDSINDIEKAVSRLK